MKLAGLDIATASGLAVCDGEVISASSFRPSAKRPFDLDRGEVDFRHEGAIAREFRDHLRAWLVSNEIEEAAIERPLVSNVSFSKPVVNLNAQFAGQAITYEKKGGTTFNVIFRLYTLAGEVCELCDRLNIPLRAVKNQDWRRSFLGDRAPPKGTKDPTKWWKDQCLMQCRRIGIDVRNADAADSVGVVWWLRGQLNPRMAAAAEDLFRPKATA